MESSALKTGTKIMELVAPQPVQETMAAAVQDPKEQGQEQGQEEELKLLDTEGTKAVDVEEPPNHQGAY